MKLLIVCALIAAAAGAPGLLRVPKVYNAVITSNQNLSPSRAIPVIQPIIHRTAYVPPIYYAHTPYSVVPEVRYLSMDRKSFGNDQAQAPSSRLVESTSFGTARGHATTAATERTKDDDSRSDDTRNESDSSPKKLLSFYPNPNSQYYVPYVYTYNSFNPNLVPGTYIDYELYSTVEPIPAAVPKRPSHLLPSFRDEARTKSDGKQAIPDVPPPPLPTSAPKRS